MEVDGPPGPGAVSERLPTGHAEVSAEGLVLAYDMRTRTARGELMDFSGRENHGTIVGTEEVEGPFGPARRFRHASDFIRLPFRRSLHIRGPLSIATWIKLRQLGVHQHLVAYDDLYTIWIDDKDRIRFADTRGHAFESVSRPGPLNEWCALVATFAGKAGTALNDRNIAIHLDGIRVPGRAFGVWDPGRPVEGFVGKESHQGQFYLPLIGDMATLLIFRRLVSDREAIAFARPFADRRAAEGLTVSNEIPNALSSTDLSFDLDGEVTESLGLPPGLHTMPRQTERPSGIGPPPRVVRITNLLPPYRLRTLEALQKSHLVRFETWLMAATERNRKWALPSMQDVRVFRDWGLDLSHREMFTVHFNPGMFRELSINPPDLVILGGYDQPTCLVAGLLLDRMRIPFLLSSESIALGDSLPGRWAPFLVREVARRSAGVIVPGQASRAHFLHLGVSPEKIFLAPNAVDVNRFVPAASNEERKAVRDALRIPEGTLFLSVGRLAEGKGLPELLDAFQSLRPRERGLRLLVLGDGRLRTQLESRILADAELLETVSFIGYVSEELLPKYYRASDIFVFPTVRDVWGLVLNEAMSAGLPAVATDGAAAALDLIETGSNGLLVSKGSAEELAAAMLRLHEDPGLRGRMGRAAREHILASFTPQHQAMGMLDAILTTLRRLDRLPDGGKGAT